MLLLAKWPFFPHHHRCRVLVPLAIIITIIVVITTTRLEISSSSPHRYLSSPACIIAWSITRRAIV
jgi:hypothetical protein